MSSSASAIAAASSKNILEALKDNKLAKQVHNAAKRVSKKRAPDDEIEIALKPKRKRYSSPDSHDETHTENLLILPMYQSNGAAEADDVAALSKVELYSNRAPLLLAFVTTLLKYTMPSQPLSSRLSLAQAYVSITSRRRAVYLGLESKTSAQDQGWGAGQHVVKVMGKEIYVLKRWPEKRNYSPPEHNSQTAQEHETTRLPDDDPALWAIDLEALKRKDGTNNSSAHVLPIYTPQSARAYLLKSFDTASSNDLAVPKKSTSSKDVMAQKERCLSMLLAAIDLLYRSYFDGLRNELEELTSSWYSRVRPDVPSGVAGWGGKGVIRLKDILDLRQKS